MHKLLKHSLTVDLNLISRSVFLGMIPGMVLTLAATHFLSQREIVAFLDVGFVPVMFFTVTGSMAIGSISSCFCCLGGLGPQDRERTRYTVDFGTEVEAHETQITTRFQRLVRHVPYFCKRCSTEETMHLV